MIKKLRVSLLLDSLSHKFYGRTSTVEIYSDNEAVYISVCNALFFYEHSQYLLYVGGLRFHGHALHVQVGGAVKRWRRIENVRIDKSKLRGDCSYLYIIIVQTVHLPLPCSFNLALSNSLSALKGIQTHLSSSSLKLEETLEHSPFYNQSLSLFSSKI